MIVRDYKQIAKLVLIGKEPLGQECQAVVIDITANVSNKAHDSDCHKANALR
jgi:hypothetical protein